MMAEGIGPGDAVFLPAFTYTATAEVPLVLGATPVFVDVDPATFQIDPAHLRQRVAAVRQAGTLRPRALVGVDLFGQPADWPALRAVAEQEALFTLDDCAQSFGASLGGRKLGREADCTAISFFPSKPLGGYGDGGAMLTDSAERAALYRSLRTHGEGTTRYEVLRTGMNGRLDTLQAAILLAKLDVFDAELAARERVARLYDRRLGNLLATPARVPDSASAWAVYAVLLPDGATPGPGAGGLARRRRADGDLLSARAAPPARLRRQPRRHRAAGVRGPRDADHGAADPPRPERCGRRARVRRRGRRARLRQPRSGLSRCDCMANQPKQPDSLPPEGSVDPETVGHTDHGIPPEADKAEPTGLPNSDRHHGEVMPTKP